MRIFLEITRPSNRIDFFRFESFDMLNRAISFLRDQISIKEVKEWTMKTVPTLAIAKYDLIED